MTKPTKLVINCSTGVESVVELTDQEIAQLEIDAAEFLARKAEKDAAVLAEAAAKASAQAKLAALGLTPEEIAAL
jgi:hypothetical protein